MENIMLQDEKKEWIKIIDFGLSNTYSEENPLKTLCGSPEYAAPELFVKGKKYGPEVDLWSFGVIVYVMGTGRLPFTSPRDESTSADERRRRLMLQINRGLSAPQERLIVTLSAECKNLLRLALMPAAHKRIRLDELRRHPWIDAPADVSANSCIDADNADKLQLCLTERQAIVREISTLESMDYREVEVDIVRRRFGNIGGIYNIMAHKMQLRKLNGSIEMKSLRSLRTPRIVKHKHEKSSHESPKKIKINGISSITKHNYSNNPRADQTHEEKQSAAVQNKNFEGGVWKNMGDLKCDLKKTKKRCITTESTPSPKKVTHPIPSQTQSNKMDRIKECYQPKPRKSIKNPTFLKFCQFQIKNKVDSTVDARQRDTCSVKKFTTVRLSKTTAIQKQNASDSGRSIPIPDDGVKRLLRKVHVSSAK